MAFVAMALLTALFWLAADVATIWRIMSGLMPPWERSCAEPARARPIARASVMDLFISSCEMVLINSFFDCKGSASRAQCQIYLSIVEAPPTLRGANGSAKF